MPPKKITQAGVYLWINEGLTEAVAELRNGYNSNNTKNTGNQPNQKNQDATNTQHKNQDTTNTTNTDNQQPNNVKTNTNQGGCTYKTFTSCEPHSFTGTEVPVGLTRWFEKLEFVFRINDCMDQAFDTTWEDLKQRMIEEYCPYNEIDKMERELQNLKLVGTDLASYNRRFFELALMCPNMVTPKRRKITLYVKGLTENIQSGVTTSKPRTIQEAVEMAHEHHPGDCIKRCDKCKKNGHLAAECKAGTNVCYGCGKTGHFRKDCPTATKNTEPARGRSFNINSNEAHDDPKLVTGTFLLDNHHAYVLFDSGADRSFVSRDFCHNLKNPVSSLKNLYSIELGNGNLMRADKVYRDCTLILAGTSFRIDVISIKIGSFDLVVGMDWLAENRADIVCYQKVIRIPVNEDEPLMVYGERSNTSLYFINCLKAQKNIRNGCLSMLVHVSKTKPEGKKLKDVPIVREFPDVFSDELPGLPPHRDVEFQIDLISGAAPVARTHRICNILRSGLEVR
ncbi:uncharacterized protein [Rutidosis leptorrhynchoides]|uniref:uncharacterized protein n=1 Tax=Rutidosis leptorrhynchoides TaxID=125765 RepID=UPI003A9A3D18